MAFQNIKLKAYLVTADLTAHNARHLFEMLTNELSEKKLVSDRRRFYPDSESSEKEESQILIDFKIGTGSRKYLFGLMADIVAYENGGDLPRELLNKDKIKINEVVKTNNKLLRCKSYSFHSIIEM